MNININGELIDVPNTRSVYKYLKSDYAKKMLEEGAIRIGTLFEYRSGEDKQRTDPDEGKLRVYTQYTSKKVFDVKNPLEGTLKEMISLNATSTVVMMPNAKATIVDSVPDAYIYCCSNILSRSLMQEFDADACIEITNLYAFQLIIGLALSKRGLLYKDQNDSGRMGHGSCVYSGREVKFEKKHEVNPYITKDPIFANQDEYRFIFFANEHLDKPLQSLFVECLDINQIIKQINI